MRTAILKLATLAIFAFMSATSFASEDESSDDDMSMSFEEKVAACTACHGADGAAPILPEYPLLAGQYKDYIANSLRQYRDGQRTNEIMALQIEVLELTDDDFEQLGEFFSTKSSSLHSLADE